MAGQTQPKQGPKTSAARVQVPVLLHDIKAMPGVLLFKLADMPCSCLHLYGPWQLPSVLVAPVRWGVCAALGTCSSASMLALGRQS
jgi:hypothetical protein